MKKFLKWNAKETAPRW